MKRRIGFLLQVVCHARRFAYAPFHQPAWNSTPAPAMAARQLTRWVPGPAFSAAGGPEKAGPGARRLGGRIGLSSPNVLGLVLDNVFWARNKTS
jgi:hypothetical protein